MYNGPMRPIHLLPLALLLFTACARSPREGVEAGDCGDGADNDEDYVTDCDDSDCKGRPECLGDTDVEDTDVEDTDDTDPADTDDTDPV